MSTPNGNTGGNGQRTGRVVQIIGPVMDVEFTDGYLPPIYQALRITSEGFDVPTPIDIIARSNSTSAKGGWHRSMQPTEGLVRGMTAIDTAGRSRCRRRVHFGAHPNVIASPWTTSAPSTRAALPDSPPTPDPRRAVPELQMFETGIKVQRPHQHSARRQDRALRRGGVGRPCSSELIHNVAMKHSGSPSSRASASARARATTCSASSSSRESFHTARPQPALSRHRRVRHDEGRYAVPSAVEGGARIRQMTEPPRALRVALSGLTVAEYFRDRAWTCSCSSHTSPLTQAARKCRRYWAHALGRRYSRTSRRDGRDAGTHHLDQDRRRSPRFKRTCRPTINTTRPRATTSRTSTRSPRSRARSSSWASTGRWTRSRSNCVCLARASSARTTTTRRSP